MKAIGYILLCIALCWQFPIFGQKVSNDSLIKKANLEIYNNPDKAIGIAKKMLQTEKDINKIIRIYLIMSNAGIAKRNFEESLQYIVKAREFVQKTNDPKAKTSFFLTAAVQFQQMELYSKSFESLDEADVHIAKIQDADYKYFEIAKSYALRGMIYKNQSNPEIALQEFLIAIKNFEKVKENQQTYYNQSIVYYNIGYCYLSVNQLNNAESAFEKSMKFASSIKAKSLEAFALKGMAEMNKQKHRNQEALELLTKAISLSKDVGDLTLNEGIYKEMADNHLAMGNQNLYQEYNKKYFETRLKREQSELSSVDRAIDIHNMEAKKRNKEIVNQYNYYIGAVVLSGLAVFGLLFWRMLTIKKRNKKYQKEIQKLIRS
ncbi:tetratricopeptide repeat protein [Chryseobacterium sp. Y16C]|uniref:tetratricopeptide repeat protein n=1 Tax=Chryseobacterium sp. Y16C TaxID=2920939 RepID=UPI001F0B0161|nr:tetratricopeptide repeat protein [Chryseobacterium sp. Y16C]UMQ40490.1 tetratricopeptide repeat protein [Chryseobacterium sp. Y16C]